MLSDYPIIFTLIALILSVLFLQLVSSKRHKACSSSSKICYPPSPPSLPIIGHLHLLKPILHQAFKELSDKYGPLLLLRIGSVRFAVASNPALAKELLKTHELTVSSRIMNIAINLITYNDATFTFAPYDTYWKFVKKLSTTELLGNQTLGQFLPIRTRELRGFIQTLSEKSKAEERVNLSESLLKLSNNVISQMMLSIRSSGTHSQAEQARELVREVTEIFGEFNVSDYIGFLKVFDLQGLKRRALQIHKRYDALLEKIISDREESRRKRKAVSNAEEDGEERVRDFLDILLDVAEEKDCEVELTRNHIKSLILDYFTAGTDTTAISVEWAISELYNNPRVQKKAQEEVDRVTGNQRLVCEDDSPNLPYINAIIKETLRLHPPVTLVTRRSIADCTVSGGMIPKGTVVFINNWAMGRDPKVWESPMEFRPERFLEGEGVALDTKGHHFELLPFGSGRRGCPGMPLVMRELPTIIGALVQCFDWKMFDSQGKLLDNGKKIDMDEGPGVTAPRANELVCIPVARVNPTPFLEE